MYVLGGCSCFQLAALWIIACQSSLSMGFSRQEYWSGLPCLPSGNLPDLWIEPASPMSPVGEFFTTEPPGKPRIVIVAEYL